jgi:hypothetical protein
MLNQFPQVLERFKTQVIRNPQGLIQTLDQTLVQQMVHQTQGLIAIGMFRVRSQRGCIPRQSGCLIGRPRLGHLGFSASALFVRHRNTRR